MPPLPRAALTLLLPLLAILGLRAQETPAAAAPETAPLAAVDRQAQVSVLCYHDFTAGENVTQMRMRTADFRAQMQALRDGGVTVVSMPEFLAWRRGEDDIPDRSVLLTFDDGWRSVYEEAFPILREFGYPFTIYLYQDFVDIGGASMTKGEILEMMENGATLGSHSVSHPYPQAVRAVVNRNEPAALAGFLEREMKQSRAFLEEQFKVPVTTYAYPGGFYNDVIRDFGLQQAGYAELFTVNPARARWDAPRGEVDRFVIHGDNDQNFISGTTFHGVPLGGAAEHQGIRVLPAPGAIISERLPLIEADLSSAGPVDPASIVMRLDGLGQVPAVFDPASGRVRYAVRAPLRDREQGVFLSWQRVGGSERADPLIWKFRINRSAAYEPFRIDEEPHLAAEAELLPAGGEAAAAAPGRP